jgi:hypothetical protein
MDGEFLLVETKILALRGGAFSLSPGYLEDGGDEQAISGFTFTLGYSRALMAEAVLEQQLQRSLLSGITPVAESLYALSEAAEETRVGSKARPLCPRLPPNMHFYLHTTKPSVGTILRKRTVRQNRSWIALSAIVDGPSGRPHAKFRLPGEHSIVFSRCACCGERG